MLLNDMKEDKAPEPNGFTATFWHSCWNVVKDDTTRMFGKFHRVGRFVRN